jgi:hypothetical protein
MLKITENTDIFSIQIQIYDLIAKAFKRQPKVEIITSDRPAIKIFFPIHWECDWVEIKNDSISIVSHNFEAIDIDIKDAAFGKQLEIELIKQIMKLVRQYSIA